MAPDSPSTFAFDVYRLDLQAGQLRRHDQPIVLRPKSWDVLRHLVEPGHRALWKLAKTGAYAVPAEPSRPGGDHVVRSPKCVAGSPLAVIAADD